MKKISFFAIFAGLSMVLMAQQDAVLLTIDGKPVMASEFMYIYQKNNQETSLEKKTMDEYLDLFINFKLKVAEAASQGVDTTEAFKKELKGYRSQAIPKYMQDDDAIDSLVELSYYRQAHPRHAMHIAVECPSNADSATVAKAMARIDSARIRVTTGLPKKIKRGKRHTIVQEKEDFAKVAVEMSSDPTVKENQGKVGWVQVFRYVYSFEDAVYNTPVGEISKVFRSPYGFHIAYVDQERDYEEVNAAHIMKMTPRGQEEREAQAKVDIDSLYALVKGGADFATVARENSDDRGSATRGGELGWFGRGMMVQPFEDSAFALRPGQISMPFQTRFGWHFIKMNDKRGMLPLDSLKEKILKDVRRDERFQQAEKAFLNKGRKEYHLPAEMSDNDVRTYIDSHLEDKYEDLRHLIQEYHDGIMLFDVSLREVWDKAAQDTVGITNFFKQNRKKYVWDEPRYKGYMIYAKDATALKSAQNIVRQANRDSIESYLKKTINRDTLLVKIEHGLWVKGKSAAVDRYGFKLKSAEYTPSEEFPFAAAVGKVLKAPEEYTDEKGKVTTDYQDLLESEWIKQLRAKYPVVVNQAVFESLKQR